MWLARGSLHHRLAKLVIMIMTNTNSFVCVCVVCMYPFLSGGRGV